VFGYRIPFLFKLRLSKRVFDQEKAEQAVLVAPLPMRLTMAGGPRSSHRSSNIAYTKDWLDDRYRRIHSSDPNIQRIIIIIIIVSASFRVSRNVATAAALARHVTYRLISLPMRNTLIYIPTYRPPTETGGLRLSIAIGDASTVS
jgi:hypothetical protein